MTDLVIHKYRLPFKSGLVDTCDVTTRIGAQLHLAIQDHDICMWAAVDPNSEPVITRFHLVGTGRTVNPSWCHLGTVIDGVYVWHIFSEPHVASGGPP